jgi:hypothetical protein
MAGTRIKEAVENSELLVDFAARNGIEVDSAFVQGVARTRFLLDQQTLKDTDEAAFFDLYGKLSRALGKVTVGSIRDSREEFGDEARKYWWFGPKVRRSKADLAVKFFRRQAIIALALLLVFQIYWLIGSTLIDGQRQIETRLKEIKEQKIFSPAKTQGQATDTPEQTVRRDALDNEESDLRTRFATLHAMLLRWRDPSLWFSRQSVPIADLQDPTKWRENFKQQIALRVGAENRLKILQVYLLPLLYGWVGACAYVLRQLIMENRERTYRSESRIAYNLRIFLGVLAGLAVGWFLQPDAQDKLVGHLAPFTISFLAGYSVEVLFSAMDKIVNAFGSVSQGSKS